MSTEEQVEHIHAILTRGSKSGLDSLAPEERCVWLISEAEVLCDMEGIDSFLDRYPNTIAETADAFAAVGATRIAESLRAIHARLPALPDELLGHANDLITARTDYDFESIARFVFPEAGEVAP